MKPDKDRKVIPGGFECNCKAGGGGHFTKLENCGHITVKDTF